MYTTQPPQLPRHDVLLAGFKSSGTDAVQVSTSSLTVCIPVVLQAGTTRRYLLVNGWLLPVHLHAVSMVPAGRETSCSTVQM